LETSMHSERGRETVAVTLDYKEKKPIRR